MTSQPSQIPILEMLSFLRSRNVLRRVAAVVLVFTLAGFAYALLAPRWFQSTLSVMPVKVPRGGGLSSILGGDAGALAAGLGASLGEGADVNRIAAVLTSTGVSDAVIAKFDLMKRYRERHQEDTREKLWKHCSIRTLPKPSLVQLTCEDKDPRFAQQMVEYFAEHGNEVFRRVNVSSASEQVRWLEKRVEELRMQAEASSERMRSFQEQYGIVDIESQTKAVVGAIAALNSQRINKQLDLAYVREFSSKEEAATRQLESQLAIVEQKLRSLENGPQNSNSSGSRTVPANGSRGLFPAALTVPKLRSEYEALFRDRKVAEATLIFALERLETAKADEARDTSTFLVLDPPTLASRHSRPRRAVAVIAAFMVGLAGAIAFEGWKSGVLGAILKRQVAPSRPVPPID